jgi:hypothetical protein
MKNIRARIGDVWYWGFLLGTIYGFFEILKMFFSDQIFSEDKLLLPLFYFGVGWTGRYILTGYKKIRPIRPDDG